MKYVLNKIQKHPDTMRYHTRGQDTKIFITIQNTKLTFENLAGSEAKNLNS